MRFAAAPFPPGTVRVYRVLFDRETVLSPAGRQEVPPLHPPPLPEGDGPEDPGALKVTTLTALPGEFRKEFRVSHGPVLLLLDDRRKGGEAVDRFLGGDVPGTLLGDQEAISRPFPPPPWNVNRDRDRFAAAPSAIMSVNIDDPP